MEQQTEWIERQAIPELGFRIWHVMLLCLSALLAIGKQYFSCFRHNVSHKLFIYSDFNLLLC